MAKTRIVAWAVIAPDGNYDIQGTRAHAEANEIPDTLGDVVVYDDHDPALCKVVKIIADVDLPEVPEVVASVAPPTEANPT